MSDYCPKHADNSGEPHNQPGELPHSFRQVMRLAVPLAIRTALIAAWRWIFDELGNHLM